MKSLCRLGVEERKNSQNQDSQDSRIFRIILFIFYPANPKIQ